MSLSQVMQASIYNDTSDCTFDPALLLARYPIQLTHLEEWTERRVHTGPIAAPLAVA